MTLSWPSCLAACTSASMPPPAWAEVAVAQPPDWEEPPPEPLPPPELTHAVAARATAATPAARAPARLHLFRTSIVLLTHTPGGPRRPAKPHPSGRRTGGRRPSIGWRAVVRPGEGRA